jgi:hypothetical protein
MAALVIKSMEIFDLQNDLSEKVNVAAEHPEVVELFTTYLRNARGDSPEWPIRPEPPAKKSASRK